MKIGYIRDSSQEQNTVRQELLMESLGVDEVYIDCMGRKSSGCPEQEKPDLRLVQRLKLSALFSHIKS